MQARTRLHHPNQKQDSACGDNRQLEKDGVRRALLIDAHSEKRHLTILGSARSGRLLVWIARP